jgi:hypothetical protein
MLEIKTILLLKVSVRVLMDSSKDPSNNSGTFLNVSTAGIVFCVCVDVLVLQVDRGI